MKRLLFLLVAMSAFFLSSCTVCTTCQIKAGDFYQSVPDEFCGTESEVQDFEDDYAKQAEELSIDNARAYCNRSK